ncbi:MAG: hypothetical protein FWG10_00790 [Eubacteriaceae bacterium]|nr:hypothetical protein [Eubacteriaceae bacterium]
MSAKKTVNVAYMYPDILSLHGDRGNIWALMNVAGKMGLELSIARYDSPNDKVPFDKIDLMVFSPGELASSLFLAKDAYGGAQAYKEYIDSGNTMLAIGSAIGIFAGEVVRKNGVYEGMGVIDATMEELQTPYSNDAVLMTDTFGYDMEIVGGQIQIASIKLGAGEKPLGISRYGFGNDKNGMEGIRKLNFFFTNFLGPVLVKNPWFAEEILKVAANNRGIDVDTSDDGYMLERLSNAEINRYIRIKAEKYDHTRLDN